MDPVVYEISAPHNRSFVFILRAISHSPRTRGLSPESAASSAPYPRFQKRVVYKVSAPHKRPFLFLFCALFCSHPGRGGRLLTLWGRLHNARAHRYAASGDPVVYEVSAPHNRSFFSFFFFILRAIPRSPMRSCLHPARAPRRDGVGEARGVRNLCAAPSIFFIFILFCILRAIPRPSRTRGLSPVSAELSASRARSQTRGSVRRIPWYMKSQCLF